MKPSEFEEEEKEVLESFRAIGKMGIDLRMTAFVGIGVLIAKLLLWIARILWAIYNRLENIEQRQDDGVNCLSRIEHAIYDWRCNR
jgi:hypothetical protein